MEWTAEVSVGDWLRERLDDPWTYTMHDVVPRGFPAYARVFHPASRDRPVGLEWPREPYTHRAWDAFHRSHADVEIIDEQVSWSTVAAAMGTTMHPLAQWGSVAGFDRMAPHRENDPRDAEGWRYQDPEEGGMPPDVLAELASVLARHTTTPDDGYVALWEGSGGLLGHLGTSPSRTFIQIGEGGPELDRHNEMLGRSLPDRFNDVFRNKTWQEGILSRGISEGPRLALPERSHVLFRGGVSELAHDDWVEQVPWRDRIGEEHGFAPSAQTPSLIWPADRAWVSVTEVDFDSTVVGGSLELVAALVADPALEALEIPVNARLSYDADEVNR